ncbi:MAG: hypothetical protein IT422_05730 [Pirellulaceae bacterium]|nr:hypothetical protein [Pirellulaceae bacterium]
MPATTHLNLPSAPCQLPRIPILHRPHASLPGVSQVLGIENDGNTPALPLPRPIAASGGDRAGKQHEVGDVVQRAREGDHTA